MQELLGVIFHHSPCNLDFKPIFFCSSKLVDCGLFLKYLGCVASHGIYIAVISILDRYPSAPDDESVSTELPRLPLMILVPGC